MVKSKAYSCKIMIKKNKKEYYYPHTYYKQDNKYIQKIIKLFFKYKNIEFKSKIYFSSSAQNV